MKRNKLFIISFLFLSLSSCTKDFLDVDNTQQLYRQNYVKDLGTMQEFLTGGCYGLLAWTFEEGHANAYPELVADNLRPVSSTSNVMTAHYTWTQLADGADVGTIVVSATSKTLDAYWGSGYKIVRDCSFVIEDVDKYKIENPAKADDIKGQALAIRAYVHFKLVNTFAQAYNFTANASHPGVPYITTSDVTRPFSRQTVAEVYEGMIADLDNAIQLLPATATDTRLMSRTAAKALLARIYLFKEDFTKAKMLATEIATHVPLMQAGVNSGYPYDLYRLKPPSQTESLFQVAPKAASPRTDFLGRFFRSPLRFYATRDVANLIKENTNDVRRGWIKDTIVGSATFYLVKKFPVGFATEVNPAISVSEISYYPAIIRSTEMFLIVAEASAKLNDEATARTYLNAVRKRANIPEIATNVPNLLDSIYKERRRELSFESLRIFDLQRWKQGVSRRDTVFATAVNLDYPNNKAVAPLPVTEISLAGLPQNPGY